MASEIFLRVSSVCFRPCNLKIDVMYCIMERKNGKKANKPCVSLLFFSWSPRCKMMELELFKSAQIQQMGGRKYVPTSWVYACAFGVSAVLVVLFLSTKQRSFAAAQTGAEMG